MKRILASTHSVQVGPMFPLESMPKAIQEITKTLHLTDNYRIEYLCSSMISAAAAAIGNSCRLRVKSSWVTSPGLYMVIVGHPGNGKTHPLHMAYEPLAEIDSKAVEEFDRALRNRREGEAMPVLKQRIINDYTCEAMKRTMASNQRGTAIVYDELMGMFKNLTRYNSGSGIEDFLSAFNQEKITVNRIGDPVPKVIQTPFLNIIGTIQTNLIPKLLTDEYMDCGLIDRFLFVLPHTEQIFSLNDGVDHADASRSAREQWKQILLQLTRYPNTVNSAAESRTIDFSDEAKKVFYDWDEQNKKRITDMIAHNLSANRLAKANLITARLALTLQLLHWCCGEGSQEQVSAEVVQKAIDLYEYFHECYEAMNRRVAVESLSRAELDVYNLLPDMFTSSEGWELCQSRKACSRTAYYRYLNNFVAAGYLLRGDRQCCKSIPGRGY